MRYIPKRMEMCSVMFTQKLHTNVYSSIIDKSQKVETAQMSLGSGHIPGGSAI